MITRRPTVTRSRRTTCGWRTLPSPTRQSAPTKTWGWSTAPASTTERSATTAKAETVAAGEMRALSATCEVGWMPGATTGSGKNTRRTAATAA